MCIILMYILDLLGMLKEDDRSKGGFAFGRRPLQSLRRSGPHDDGYSLKSTATEPNPHSGPCARAAAHVSEGENQCRR